MPKLSMPIGHYFRWKILLLRIPVNALALVITAIFIPDIYFVQKTLGALLLMAVVLGVINAILKPILQILTLPFLFATYGLVLVLMNGLILWLVSWFFPSLFAVHGFLTALVGGAFIGLVGSFLENLFGLTPPIHAEAFDPTKTPALADRLVARLVPEPSMAPESTALENPDSQPAEVTDA